MDIKEFMAVETTMDIVDMVQEAVEHITVVKHALSKMGVPEEIVSDLIMKLAEIYETKYSEMTLDELTESIGRR